AQCDFRWCWTGAAAWGRVEPLGWLQGDGCGTGGGGTISNENFKRWRCAIHRHGAHGAYETTHDVVGLDDPVKSCLAGTGWRDGGGSGASFTWRRIFRMTSPWVTAAMSRSVPLMAKRAGGQIEGKHPLQEPRPAPVWRGAAGLRPFHTLLVWRRRNCAAQAAVRRQTASVPRYTRRRGTRATRTTSAQRDTTRPAK